MSARQKTRLSIFPVLVLCLIGVSALMGVDCRQKVESLMGDDQKKTAGAETSRPVADPNTPQRGGLALADGPAFPAADEGKTMTAQVPTDISDLTVKSLSLADDSGQVRATLKLEESGAPAFTLLEPDGRARTRVVLQPDGVVALDLLSPDGAVMTSYWVQEGKPYLAYLDAKGKVVTIIPKNGIAPSRPGAAAVAGGVAGGMAGRPAATTGAGGEAVGASESAATSRGRRSRGGAATSGNTTESLFFLEPSDHTFHTRSCAQLHGDQKPMSLQDAVGQGYKPCPKCKPAVLQSPPLGTTGTGR